MPVRPFLLIAVLAACQNGPTTPPAVASAEPEPAPTALDASLPPAASVPPVADASVPRAAGDAAPPDAGIACGSSDPRMAACKWSVEMLRMCTAGMGNVPANYQELRPHCRCDGCVADGDCKAKTGGRCVALNDACYSESVCVYPGDPCFGMTTGSKSCGGKKTCTHDGAGHALCREVKPSPPVP